MDVTVYLQDHPRLNVLLRTRQFTPALIRIAAKMMMAAFNKVNWVSGYRLEDLGDELYDVLINGTIFQLFNSETALQVRNHLPYNDAGLSVAEFSKSGEYASLAGGFEARFKEGALQWKYERNIMQGFGGVMSEYSMYGGYAMMNQ